MENKKIVLPAVTLLAGGSATTARTGNKKI
jgi:hypothetical protein